MPGMFLRHLSLPSLSVARGTSIYACKKQDLTPGFRFAGFPAAINAMVIAKQVFADRAAGKK
jgi:hypothetical protein